jgi:hypothetical protein
MQLKKGMIPSKLSSLQHSMHTLMALTFFITAHMSSDLHQSGTLPILYVFLARSGKTIRDVSLVNVNGEGELTADEGPRGKPYSRGAKIVFADADGRVQTLYYFSTDVSNAGIKRNGGFLAFCGKLGDGDSFVKSASYLMHGGEFSQVRDFLLKHSAVILQDDTGVPLKFFDTAKWDLSPHGNYLTPIPVFAGVYQPKMQEFFRKSRSKPIDFGVGYRYRPGESNLLLAVKHAPEKSADKSVEKPAPAPAIAVSEKPAAKAPETAAEKPVAQAPETSAEKPAAKTPETTAEKPGDGK